MEGFLDAREDSGRRRVVLGEIVAAQVLLHLVLDVEGQPVLQEATHFPSILAVAVAN